MINGTIVNQFFFLGSDFSALFFLIFYFFLAALNS